MKVFKKISVVISGLILAAVCMLFAVACEFTFPLPTPSPTPPGPDVPPIDDDSEYEKLTAGELIEKIYNASAGSFTVKVSEKKNFADEHEEKSFELVYDAESACKLIAGESEYIFSGGVKYERTGETEVEKESETGREKVVVPTYKACSDDSFVSLKTIDNSVSKIFDELLSMAGESLTVTKEKDGAEIALSFEPKGALGEILSIFKENIDEPAIKSVTEILNRTFMTELTDEQAGAMIVLYGDSTFSQLLDIGFPMTRFEFAMLYSALLNSAGESNVLPSYEKFMSTYGRLSLSKLLGVESAEKAVGELNEQTLSEILKRFEYTSATLSELVSSEAATEIAEAKMSLKIKADRSYHIASVSIDTEFKVKNLPVFEPSLDEDGIREKTVEASYSYSLSADFSDVSKSEIVLPEYYLFDGNQKIAVSAAGQYSFRAGKLNKTNKDEGVVIQTLGAPVTDLAAWAKLMNGIREGVEIDAGKHILKISKEAYECMLKAQQMGMTSLIIKSYEDFDFVIEL